MWWLDKGRNLPCCLRATPEELDDPDLSQRFNCVTCDVAAAEDDLDAENQDAWAMYATLCSRAVAEFGLGAPAFEAFTEGWSGDERTRLLKRLSLMRSMLAVTDGP